MKKNLWIKVIAVLLAVGLWMFVISRGQSELSLEVPVVYRDLPTGLQVAGAEKTVTLVVRGHERFIRNLSPEDIHVSVNVADLKKGIHPYRVTRSDVKLPAALRVVSIFPSAINVQAEETLKKRVHVTPVVTGTPLEGFRRGMVEVVPEEVMVEGMVNEVRRLQSLETEPVDVSSASATVVAEAKIRKPGGSVLPEVNTVTVRVVIVKE